MDRFPVDYHDSEGNPIGPVLAALASPIDRVQLATNLRYLASFVTNETVRGVGKNPDRLDVLIQTMADFAANDTPTNAEAIAALRAVCESSVAVERVTLAVLADVVRHLIHG